MEGAAAVLLKQAGVKTTNPPAGDPPAGNPPAGNNPPVGDPPAGDPPAGDPPAGNNPPADPKNADPKGDPKTTIPLPTAIDDAAIKEYLKTKHGIEVEDLGDLKPAEKPLTEEEQNKLNEKIKEDAIKHGINKNIFSTKDFTAYTKDSQRPAEDVAFEVLKQQWIKDDPTLEEKDLEARFREYFKLDEPEDNWLRKGRNQELIAIANRYFEVKYPKIINAETEYTQHLKGIQDATEYTKKIERAFTNLPVQQSFEIDLPTDKEGVSEKKAYKFSFSKEDIDEVRKQVLEESSFNSMRNMTNEGLSQAIELALIKKSYAKMVVAVAREHGADLVLSAKAGRKGIVPDNVTLAGNQATPQAAVKGGVAASMLKEEKRN